ncbi:hypothetical protein B296_00031114 [Ensete ventricosum]|uniref:PH domain-containing protein n=1 Tax=Ensete ventricosum TaxID=4639 RepID=A0A427AH17_ENSVE|nr:hypothetical protein B296_00031114 [Ensete ventricosum]
MHTARYRDELGMSPSYGEGRRSVKGEGRRRGRLKKRENQENLDAKPFLDPDPASPSLDNPNPGGNDEAIARAAEEAVSFVALSVTLRLLRCVLRRRLKTSAFSTSLSPSSPNVAVETMRRRGGDVHGVLINIVSAVANATPGLGRYPPFKRELFVSCKCNFSKKSHHCLLFQLGYTKNKEEKHFRGVIALEIQNKAYHCPLSPLNWADDDEPPKGSKDSRKANGPEKSPSLVFKITSKVAYKTVLKAHSAVVLKAENMADKVGWINKIQNIIGLSKVTPLKGADSEANPAIRQSHSDGSLLARRPADPEEELRWMSQEVRGYVEAVLNSLAANVPKVNIAFRLSPPSE